MNVILGISPQGAKGPQKKIGPKRKEVTGYLRKFHIEGFIICTFPDYEGDQMKNQMYGSCSTHVKKKNFIEYLVRKSEGKKYIMRLRLRKEDNVTW
jgi:hypothetical protein